MAPGREANLVLFRWNAQECSLILESVVVRGRLIPIDEMKDAMRPAGQQAF